MSSVCGQVLFTMPGRRETETSMWSSTNEQNANPLSSKGMASGAVTMAMAGGPRWKSTSPQEAALVTAQQPTRALQSSSSDTALHHRSNDSEGSNSGLRHQSPRKIRGRRRWDKSRSWQEMKTMDNEFDMVIVPPDGCYMSGSDSDGSDWSVGWYEPHSAGFAENDHGVDAEEESFAVLVPSYVMPASDFFKRPKKSTNAAQRTSKTPKWESMDPFFQ